MSKFAIESLLLRAQALDDDARASGKEAAELEAKLRNVRHGQERMMAYAEELRAAARLLEQGGRDLWGEHPALHAEESDR